MARLEFRKPTAALRVRQQKAAWDFTTDIKAQEELLRFMSLGWCDQQVEEPSTVPLAFQAQSHFRISAMATGEDHYVAIPPSPGVQLVQDPASQSDDRSGQKKTKLPKPTPADRYAQQIPFRERPENPLQTASVASVITTHWLQPLVSLGAHKILDKEDIWKICPEDSCEALQARFLKHYNTDAPHSSWLTTSRVSLALMKTFRRELAVIYGNYLVYVVAMAMQTYIANAMLDFLYDRENVFHIRNGYVLVLLMFMVSFVAVTCLNYGFFLASRVGVNFRSLMMDIVYQKSLRLSSSARQAYTTGEIVTLMSVDSERIFNDIINGPWFIIAPVAFVISIVLIAFMFDAVSAFCGAVLLVAMLYASTRLGAGIGNAQRQLFKVVEKRVRVTSEALQGIRVMKFYAWEDSLARRVEVLRKAEIKIYRKFHILQVVNTTMLFLSSVLLGGVVYGVYVAYRGDISVTAAYTLVAMVNISRLAVTLYPQAIASMSQAKIAYTRIDAYMASDELGIDSMDAKESTKRLQEMTPGSISVRDASFQWAKNASSAEIVVVKDHESSEYKSGSGFRLEGVNIDIDAGSLVMIVGKVGSGKSSLLEALLGEMVMTSGMADTCGDIAYVSQEAWIRNSSVKNNILFETEFDMKRYSRILEATQLSMDLYALPNGDETEIGERGINLSGGQKARVSIARAMYRSNYDILILDDPLSAVDPHVAHAIFDQCIVGLAKSKTRLLVLNSHYDLLKHADKILVVDNGQIAGDGTYEDIVQQFPDLQQHSKELEEAEQDTIDEHTTDEDSQIHLAAVVLAEHAQAPDADAIKSEDVEQKPEGEDSSRLVKAEDRVRGRVSGETYNAYFNETGFNGLLVVAVLLVVNCTSQGLRVLVDWWQGHWSSNMSRDGVDPTYSASTYALWYYVFIVVCCVVTLSRGLLLMECCMRSSRSLHNELFRRVLSAPVNRYFDVTPVGQILNRFSNDLDQVDSVLPLQYQYMIQNLIAFAGSLVVCSISSVWVGLSYIPMLVIFVLTGLYFKKTSREVKRLESITRTPVFNLFSETLSGLQTIRAFKMQDKFIQLNKQAVDINTSYYFTYWAAGRWLAVRLDYLSVVIILVVSIYLVGTKGQLTQVVAGITITYSLMLTSMVQAAVRGWDRTDNAMTGVERLLHFRSIPVETDAPNSLNMNDKIWPTQGAVRFENLCLKYRPELPLVLRGVNMDIGAGEKVGICGRTGAGKSSLMIALFRICDFESGTIFIDGTDIQNVKLRDLRRSLAIIPQDPVLFSGSLRENLDPHDDYSDNAIWSVLKQVHLSDNVEKWGNGLDFIVAEQGDNLSVGQRQLLCIGRALLKDSKIVVLDEATANVDTATDNLIQVTIRETFQTKTVLIIAHRINTIMHCDKIAVMDAGQVAEFGSPTELLSRPESIFASIASRSSQQ